jgi:uncharacterized protein DUF6249
MIFLLFSIAIIALTILIIALLNHRIKIRMIRLGFVDENAVKALNKLNYDLKIDTLKWGLILLFGGAGLIVLNYIQLQPDTTMPYGIETLFLAAGFLAYYFITIKNKAQ